MNKLLIFTILLISFHACKAQKDIPPPIEKIELVTENGIQYKFPSNIENELNKAINKEEKSLHLIELETINDSTYTLIVYSLSETKDGIMSSNKFISKTGRYYKYKSNQIPIILSTDYKFSTPGFVITDGGYWIKFKYRNNIGLLLNEEE